MEEKEVKELVKEEKKNSRKDGERSLFGKIVNIVLWVIVLGWMAICITDFLKVQAEKEPIFCLKNETVTYDDGTVDVCTGLGYKVYDYDRDCFQAIEFGPFWTKDASLESDRCE
ncbi:MAG TPA: hypothetical protein PLX66_01460 [Bacilli bacterium]|nr:hypothetical protein [Bacilli bacterium]